MLREAVWGREINRLSNKEKEIKHSTGHTVLEEAGN